MTEKILQLAHRMPYPPNRGDKIRSFNILKYIAQTYELHLATLIDNFEDIGAIPDLDRYLENVVHARIDQKGRQLLSLRAMLMSQSITVCHFYLRKMQILIDNLIEENSFHAIICTSSAMAEYLFRSRHRNGRLTNVMKIMDLVDVDSFKWRQYAQSSSVPRSFIYNYEAAHLAKYERRIYEYFDHILLVSEQEREYFPGGDSLEKLCAVTNGVDLEFFDPKVELHGQETNPTLVFTGMMDYLPNILGMRWFINEVLPRIKREVPNIQLIIVGGKPNKEVRSWGERECISVTGFVDDIREYLQLGDVCIVPLHIARGIQNKVLEAMAMEKAVVSTPQALEGIDLQLGKHALVADSADEFAEKTIWLLGNKDVAKKIGKEARRFVNSKHSWGANLAHFESILVRPSGLK